MRPAINAASGPALVRALHLSMEFGADLVALFISMGDEDRAATCAARCVKTARLLGYEEEKRS